MQKIVLLFLLSLSCLVAASARAAEPLKVLIVTGGCCHDYKYQTDQLKLAFKEHKVETKWTVVMEGGTGTKAKIELYDDADWAKDFDVVIHNECFANTTDIEYIKRITGAHQDGANAVVIHCAMHTYRAAEKDQWRQLLGVTSRRHEHQSNYPVRVVEKKHPIMQGFPSDWVTPKDELYIIENLWPNAKPLATSVSEKTSTAHPCFWTNTYGKARVFGTTYGHSNETFADPVFQQAIVRGSLWAAGKLKAHDTKQASK
ncbi:MAG: ThuA domain-containing protein [Aureliella sp.]